MTELEWIRSESGAVKTDLECDPRPKIQDALFSQLGGGGGKNRSRDSDSDNDDW